ncbi:hypothetical protein HanPI659440_Chr06g0240841 [Helianthus annuus]|nr:hypothetical protein HanPI659440_Chr06g0240841 [Helianthus annuus]
MQGNLSAWLVKHALIHRSLGFDYQGIETLQIKPGDWHSMFLGRCVFLSGVFSFSQRVRLRYVFSCILSRLYCTMSLT